MSVQPYSESLSAAAHLYVKIIVTYCKCKCKLVALWSRVTEQQTSHAAVLLTTAGRPTILLQHNMASQKHSIAKRFEGHVPSVW